MVFGGPGYLHEYIIPTGGLETFIAQLIELHAISVTSQALAKDEPNASVDPGPPATEMLLVDSLDVVTRGDGFVVLRVQVAGDSPRDMTFRRDLLEFALQATLQTGNPLPSSRGKH